MLMCPSCGAENPDGFTFCGRCGHGSRPRPASTRSKSSPRCRLPISSASPPWARVPTPRTSTPCLAAIRRPGGG
ncbi:MAG: zinc-ribbon domain-containing protein [Thermoleophilia bacterium]|nr:zinc-ribbon domain-containing protein [Thermoleophilia bacterium]